MEGAGRGETHPTRLPFEPAASFFCTTRHARPGPPEDPRIRNSLQDQLLKAGQYELVPAAAGERIRARVPEAIVVWNTPAADAPAEDDPYKDFPIPDDLMW